MSPEVKDQIDCVEEQKRKLDAAIEEYLDAHERLEGIRAQLHLAHEDLHIADQALSQLAWSMDGVHLVAWRQDSAYVLKVAGEPLDVRNNVTATKCASVVSLAVNQCREMHSDDPCLFRD